MSDDQTSRSLRRWLREAARDQRRRATPTEQRLWAVLRARQFAGWRFRRQQPVGPYIADFLCAEARLIVEIDGAIHADQREYDAERDAYLEGLGYGVLRFSADRVTRDLPHVLAVIQHACEAVIQHPCEAVIQHASAAPPLPRTGEGGGG